MRWPVSATVRKAMAIIGPKARESDVERTVHGATMAVARQKTWKQSGRYGTWTKAQKRAAGRVAAALRRLEAVLKDPDLEKYVRDSFPLDEIDFERWTTYCQKASETPLPKTWLRDPARREAAKQAARLLKQHDIPLRVTRRGKFCRLAALLYCGDEKADLFYDCRLVKK